MTDFIITKRVNFLNFIVSASTDIGIKKATNQDSLSVKVFNTKQGKMVFSVLCDGMGGLAKGELASATLVEAFNDWMCTELPALCEGEIDEKTIASRWSRVIAEQNLRIMQYGRRFNANIGTTVVVMLLTETKYYIMNVGDSRAYEIAEGVRQITKDQTVVAYEVEIGKITPEQALNDPRRSVLLQCVGASEEVTPAYYFGETKQNAVYMVCSDGFIHEITGEELFDVLSPNKMISKEAMKSNTDSLIDLNKMRMEKDNISVVTVRTF